MDRVEGRIQRLLDARAKLMAKMELHNENREAMVGWEKRLAEYNDSLFTFQKYGKEFTPSGNAVSINIDVPKGTFTITAPVPGG